MMANRDEKLKCYKLEQENIRLKEELEKFSYKSEKEIQLEKRNLVHQYNEIKDIAQILIGAVANIEGLTIKQVHQALNLPTD